MVEDSEADGGRPCAAELQALHLATATEVAQLNIGSCIHSAAWSADSRVVLGLADGTLRICSAAAKALGTLRGHTDYVRSVCWHIDLGRLASVPADCTARLWAVDGRTLAAVYGHRGHCFAVRFARDGRVATGLYDGTVRIWCSDLRKLLATLHGHTDFVRSVAWPEDGRLASASRDRTISVWTPSSLWVVGELRCMLKRVQIVRRAGLVLHIAVNIDDCAARWISKICDPAELSIQICSRIHKWIALG